VSNTIADALPDWDDVSFNDGDEEEEPVAPVAPAISFVPSQQEQNVVLPQPVVEQTIASEVNHTQPSLSVTEVKEKWENIKRRIKARKDGSMVAAILNDYTIVGVEGTHDLPILLIKALSKFHYETLQKDERRKSIEWAMKIELGQECQVRLLPPGQVTSGQNLTIPLPPISTRDMGGRVANSGIATQPQPSAYRERSAPTSVPTPQKPTTQESMQGREPTNAAPPTVPLAQTTNTAPPLARTHIVRENTNSDGVASVVTDNGHVKGAIEVAEQPPETRREVLEKKAKNDLVVQEVIRMFKANIKDVQPKQ